MALWNQTTGIAASATTTEGSPRRIRFPVNRGGQSNKINTAYAVAFGSGSGAPAFQASPIK